MTLTIDLTPEEEARLTAAAAVAGLDPVGYLRSIIGQEPTRTHIPLTGRALVEQLRRDGVIGAGFGDATLDSPEAARLLRAQVWRTRQADGIG